MAGELCKLRDKALGTPTESLHIDCGSHNVLCRWKLAQGSSAKDTTD